VLDTSTFSTSKKEGEKVMTEKEFDKSLLTLVELMKKLRNSVSGQIIKDQKEEKEVENVVVDNLNIYLAMNLSSNDKIIGNENSQVGVSGIQGGGDPSQSPSMLSPEWIKYISLTVRTVISWCTLLLLSALDRHPPHSPPPSTPHSLPSFVKEGMWKARKELQVTIGKRNIEAEKE
jgi:hypothetical protein